jgi:predicted Fe-Mo cluster-binding NifX family protein
MTSHKKLRIAVATNERGGLEDTVSKIFGRAKSFTIVNVENDDVKSVEVIQNPAVSYKYGAGPIVVKMLVDSGVNIVLAAELGLGASALLEQHNVTNITIEPGSSVSETIKNALAKIEK